MVTAVPVTDSTPATVGVSSSLGAHSSSAAISSATAPMTCWTRAMSSEYATDTSTIPVDQPWLWLPTCRISPLRTYQTIPLESRSRVTRRPTASTVPVVPSPVSTRSPTPYWSSRIRKMPDKKSLTSVCAPKPSATPTMPALASSGPIGRPMTSRIISSATPMTTPVMTLRSTDAMVSARCLRRSDSSALSRSLLAGPLASTPGTVPSAARCATWRMRRCRTARIATASRTITRIPNGFTTSQSPDSASHSLWVRS